MCPPSPTRGDTTLPSVALPGLFRVSRCDERHGWGLTLGRCCPSDLAAAKFFSHVRPRRGVQDAIAKSTCLESGALPCLLVRGRWGGSSRRPGLLPAWISCSATTGGCVDNHAPAPEK